MAKIFSILIILFLILSSHLSSAESSKFKDIVGSQKIMVVFTEVNEYTLYAESIIKERLQAMGYRMVDPETLEKVKKNKLLWEAINNDALAMAKIMTDMTDFDAEVLIKGVLTAESHPRFTNQWESSASVSIKVIDIRTAGELFSTQSEPLGSTGNPMPVEDSPLVAKQVAIKKAVEDIILKLGIISSEDVYRKATFSPEFYKKLYPAGKVRRIQFSPDSRTVAVVNDYSVDIMDIYSGKQIARYEVPDVTTSVSFGKNGEMIVIGTDSRYIYIYERRTNSLKLRYKTSGSYVTSVVFSNEGSLLAAGFADGHIELVNVKQEAIVGNLSGHLKRVHSLAFSPNDRFLVSVSDDLLTKFWDVNIKRETRSFKEPMDRLFLACLSVDGSLIALNAKEIDIDLLRNRRTDKRFLVIRNTSTGEEVRRFNLPKDISSIAFYPNKRYIASASQDNTVRIWDINTGAEISVLTLESSAVSLDFSRDGKFLAYAAEGVVTIIKL